MLGAKGMEHQIQKRGRSLCTLYPMDGFFISLVVIGRREEEQMPLVLPILSNEAQALY